MDYSSGGCSNKIGASELIGLLTDAGIGLDSPSAFADAYIAALPPGENSIATSIDLIYNAGLSPADFGTIAVAHGLSDIYAALSTPLVATVCLGLPHTSVTNGTGSEILAGIQSALKHAETEFGGGHTVFSHRAFVAVSATGTSPRALTPPDPAEQYTLVMSKQLGSGLYLSAHRNGMLSAPAHSELLRVAHANNAAASRSLRGLLDVDDTSVAFATDITGFGFVIGLYSQVPTDWEAFVDPGLVPKMSDTMLLVTEHGLTTTLGEKNLEWADGRDDVDLSQCSLVEKIVLSDPQTSGGLLAAIRSDAVEKVLNTCEAWSEVGILRYQGPGASQPKVVVTDSAHE